MVSAIVAVDKKWGIGKDGKLLVNIPADMKVFKKTTKNSIVVMGKKTWDSLPNKPLPNRINYIISRNQITSDNENIRFVTLPEVINLLQSEQEKNIFIIGGGQIYAQLLNYCDVVHVTKINSEYNADTFFHDLDNDICWKIIYDSGLLQDKNTPQYRFIVYKKQEVS